MSQELSERLGEGALSYPETLRLGHDLMSALHGIHQNGQLHGDINPTRVMLDKLPDGSFSGALLPSAGYATLRNISAVGYLAPEQWGLLHDSLDHRADLYSIGALLFHCLSGQPPFCVDSLVEVRRLQIGEFLPPTATEHGTLQRLVARLLRADPAERYQSARSVLADLGILLEAWQSGEPDPSLELGTIDRNERLAQPVLVGRDREMARLRAELDLAIAGASRLVTVEARSGCGKTRLLDEVAAHAVRCGIQVLRGRAQSPALQPLQLLHGVVAELLADAMTAARVRTCVEEHLDVLVACLPALSPVLRPDSNPPDVGPEAFGEARIVSALRALLDVLGTAEQPVLLLLDDAQWADELTRRVLQQWWKGASSSWLIVVLGARSDELAADHDLGNLEPSLRLELEPLDADAVRTMVSSMARIPEEAIGLVADLAGGNPFMVAAVLHGLVETAVLQRSDDGWVVQRDRLVDVQASHHAATLLVQRFRRLSRPTLDFLSAAAVLGREFDAAQAAHLANVPPTALDEALERGLVWRLSRGNRLTFVHDKLRETMLGMLDEAERQSMHEKAAVYLGAHGADDLEVACHFDAAQQPVKALPYALRAGEQARSRYALQTAEQQYRIAWKGSQSLEVAEALGDVLMLRGRYVEAAPFFEEARRLASGIEPRSRIERKLGELAFKRGDIREAAEATERALKMLGYRVPTEKIGFALGLLWEILVQVWHTWFPRLMRRAPSQTPSEAIKLHSRLTYVYFLQRGVLQSVWSHLRELNMAEHYPETRELAQAYSEHALCMSAIPFFTRGIRYAEAGLAMRQRLRDTWGCGQSMSFFGLLLLDASRFRESEARGREAMRLLSLTGDLWEYNTALVNLACSLYRSGDLRGALRLSQQAYQSGTAIGDMHASGWSLFVWSIASGGRVPAELLKAFMETHGEDASTRVKVLMADAIRLLREGQTLAAVSTMEDAQRLVDRSGSRRGHSAWALPWLATVLRRAAEETTPCEPARRADLLRQAWKAANRATRSARRFRNNLPQALRELGIVAAMRGDAARSRRFLDESLRVAESQEACYEAALTRLARGEIGTRLLWAGAAEDLERGRSAQQAIEVPEDVPTPLQAVADAAKRIASAATRDAIFAELEAACKRLVDGDLVLGAADPQAAVPVMLQGRRVE